MRREKVIFLKLFLAGIFTTAVLTILSSNSYFCGIFLPVAVFIYNTLPQFFYVSVLIIAVYLCMTGFVFLFFWLGKFKRKYIYWILVIVAYFSLNVLASRFIHFEFPNLF